MVKRLQAEGLARPIGRRRIYLDQIAYPKSLATFWASDRLRRARAGQLRKQRCGREREQRGFSSAGRAPALQAGGHRFDPDKLHHYLSSRLSAASPLTCGRRGERSPAHACARWVPDRKAAWEKAPSRKAWQGQVAVAAFAARPRSASTSQMCGTARER